jgi:hypothetical protein
MSRSSKPSISQKKRHRPNRVRQRGKNLDLFACAGGWEEGALGYQSWVRRVLEAAMKPGKS